MRLTTYRFVLALSAAAFPFAGLAQQSKRNNEADFVKEKPAVGEKIPELTVYRPDGKEVKTADLRGHYTVLTFGCLT